MHTNYRLFVLTESDAVMVILSAGQQSSAAEDAPGNPCLLMAQRGGKVAVCGCSANPESFRQFTYGFAGRCEAPKLFLSVDGEFVGFGGW